MSKTMVLVGGAWVEKPVMFGAPNWRGGTPTPTEPLLRIGMTKRNAVVVTSGTEPGPVNFWQLYSDNTHEATLPSSTAPDQTAVSNSMLLPTGITPGRYRLLVRINGFPSADLSSTTRAGFYIEMRSASGAVSRPIDVPDVSDAGDLPQSSVMVDLSGGEQFSVFVYRRSLSYRFDTTKPNFVMVESI